MIVLGNFFMGQLYFTSYPNKVFNEVARNFIPGVQLLMLINNILADSYIFFVKLNVRDPDQRKSIECMDQFYLYALFIYPWRYFISKIRLAIKNNWPACLAIDPPADYSPVNKIQREYPFIICEF